MTERGVGAASRGIVAHDVSRANATPCPRTAPTRMSLRHQLCPRSGSTAAQPRGCALGVPERERERERRRERGLPREDADLRPRNRFCPSTTTMGGPRGRCQTPLPSPHSREWRVMVRFRLWGGEWRRLLGPGMRHRWQGGNDGGGGGRNVAVSRSRRCGLRTWSNPWGNGALAVASFTCGTDVSQRGERQRWRACRESPGRAGSRRRSEGCGGGSRPDELERRIGRAACTATTPSCSSR